MKRIEISASEYHKKADNYNVYYPQKQISKKGTDWSDCDNIKDLFRAVANGYDWRTVYCLTQTI